MNSNGKACRKSSSNALMMVGVGGVSVTVGVVVLEEDGLVCEVTGKGDSGNTETGEGALESVPAREGTGVSPSLAMDCVRERNWNMTGGGDVLSGPGIVSGLA